MPGTDNDNKQGKEKPEKMKVLNLDGYLRDLRDFKGIEEGCGQVPAQGSTSEKVILPGAEKQETDETR
jgi:hypothetical protein